MKRALAVLVLALLVSATFGVRNGRAQYSGGATIRADGTVEGTDKIQRVGDVYTLTGNIDISGGYTRSAIQVLKDNIVIEGANFSITTQDSGNKGIDLSGRNNVVVKNLVIKGFKQGIFLEAASGNTIYRNEITGFSGNGPYGVPTGIWISQSSNNKIESNTITSNINFGILVQAASTENTIAENTITDNGVGIALDYCPNNILRNNQINDNDQNFKLGYNTFSQFIQDIDTSNTINGKPLYYWLDEHNKTVPSNAGFVALGNCTNITVKNLEISHNYDSITLINTNNSIITSNYIISCGNGIFLKHCRNINVTENTITGNLDSGIGTLSCTDIIIAENKINLCKFGITTAGQTSNHVGGLLGSTNMTIHKNNITRSDPGIYLDCSRNNIISNNYIAKNIKGINAEFSHQNIIVENTFYKNTEGAVRICGSQNNTFYHNDFIDNDASGIQISNPWLVAGNPEDNYWDNGFQGNYWNDFKQRYPNATEISGSGIWDTPYHINEKNIDRYPLVAPFISDQSSTIPQTPSPETEPSDSTPSEPPQTPPPESKPSDSTPSEFPTSLVFGIVILVSVATISAGLLFYFRKRKHRDTSLVQG